MVRTYKRKPGARPYRNYSAETLQAAIKDVKTKKLSLRKAASKYGIPTMTLFNYYHQPDVDLSKENQPVNPVQTQNPPPKPKLQLRTPGHPTVFTREEEEMLCDNLATVGDWGFPVSGFQLQCIIEAYLNSIGREVARFKNGTRPGPDWVSSFLKRNSSHLKARNCTNIKRSRAAVSREVIKDYFQNLGKVVRNIPPGNIVNYDETNFSDDPKSNKMIYRRKVKRAERIINFTKTAYSVMFAVTDSGETLPVYVVYKGQHKWSTWTQNGPQYARYNCTKSGWFDEQTFHEWLCTVIIPWAESREGIKMLIGDNLSSHFCPDVIKKCEEHDILFVCLPKNSTHLTQPLDVALFAPMKRMWRNCLLEWKSKEGRSLASLPKDHFPRLLNSMLLKMEVTMAKTIRAGFLTTGIRPFDQEKVLKKLPDDDKSIQSPNVSAAMIDFLKDLRHSTPIRKQRKKLIDVPAGVSVTSDDFPEIAPLDQPSSSRPDTSKKVGKPSCKAKVMKKTKRKTKKEKNTDSDLESIDFEELNTVECSNKGKGKALKKKTKKIKIEEESDSDLESIASFKSDKSDDLRFGVESIIAADERENQTLEIKPKAWVIVTYATKQKKKHFVGEVLSTYGSPVPDTCDIRFLRKVPGSLNVFQWPELCDEELNVPFSDIVAVLNEPTLDRRGLLSFSHKFDGLEIQ